MKNVSSALSGAVALSLIVIVTSAGCPLPPSPPDGFPLQGPVVITPDPIDPIVPFVPTPVLAVPVFFYLDGRYTPTPTPTPTMKDTGRMGFMAAYMEAEAAKNLVFVSADRETDGHPVVYFYGIEGVSRVEVHFDRESDFPSRFAVFKEDMQPALGGLSAYDTDTGTFSLELRRGADSEVYPILALNKSLFDAYPAQGDMTGSQYRRAKNILTSLALWTSIAYQTGETALSAAGVRDISGVMFACSPADLAESGAETVIGPVAVSARVGAASVSIATMSAAAALAIAAEFMPDDEYPAPDEPPPVVPPITIAPGDPGPAGGVLGAQLEGIGDWFEVAPQDIGLFPMRGGAAEKACEDYSVTVKGAKIGGWYLPGAGELTFIYESLYKEGKIDYCTPRFYWSSTLNGGGETYYISINFSNGRTVATDSEHELLVLPVRRVSEEEITAFKKAQDGD
jgi:hypothetical protein